MQLKTVDGQLTLGSVYKLFVVGWLCSWLVFAGFILAILVLMTLFTGDLTVNDELVHGRGAALAAMAPMLILVPIIIVMQAFMFGAFLTGGVWLYRLRRPLTVVDTAVSSPGVF